MTDYLAAFHHPAEQSSTGQNPFAASSLLETVDREEAMNEMMLLGLRLTDGVSFNDFAGRFGTR
jgi:coproporphyrinogen III oxidase-like Fe-S oxidoreductase